MHIHSQIQNNPRRCREESLKTFRFILTKLTCKIKISGAQFSEITLGWKAHAYRDTQQILYQNTMFEHTTPINKNERN